MPQQPEIPRSQWVYTGQVHFDAPSWSAGGSALYHRWFLLQYLAESTATTWNIAGHVPEGGPSLGKHALALTPFTWK